MKASEFEKENRKLKLTKQIYSNEWITLNDRSSFYTLEPATKQVAVLAIVDKKDILLVKVKRPVINDITWELPAGGAEWNETPLVTVQRELKEETGIDIELSRFREVESLILCPNRFPCAPYIYFVDISCDEFSMRKAHDHEIAEVALFSLSEISEMILSSEIYLALPVTVLSRYLLSKQNNLLNM
ncbi:NUDIX hydrolase [Catenovulum maritimum]|uniref:GDP-mannose pyrophosphatase n=1 Tax=Catenovulum maritimum TaxID=1513271 RepID=A0A0J8GUZ2_9ALTE|nr:NUDIX hydrolase [Catenovulum maritimum]KMT66600.1 hypothetical protein XM47_03450 [Catenovulum maritimum]